MYSKVPSKTLDLLIKMLQKDPQHRITAEGALAHAFFASEMDVELPLKEVRASMAEDKGLGSKRKEAETPTTQNGKVGDRPMLFNFDKREVRPYYYS